MSNDDKKKQAVYNQTAWILNYQPQIEHQHIHVDSQPASDEPEEVDDDEYEEVGMARPETDTKLYSEETVRVEPELPPVDRFVNMVKAIMKKAATKNGEKIVTNTRAWQGEYVFFVDGERIAKMMDDLRKNYEEKIKDFLQPYQKCDGVTVVAPFIGKVLDIEELRAQDLQKSDLAFAFTPYYKNGTSAVKRMSDKMDSEAAKMLLGILQGLLRKYPKS